MTREEAIEILKSKLDGKTDTSYEWVEAVGMAIKALTREDACNSIKMVTNAKEAEKYKISEDISKGFEKFTELMYKQGARKGEGEQE